MVYFFICLFGIAILFQAARIQLVEGDFWKKKADSTTTDYRKIEAIRGNIYAADGSLLATSLPIYEVRMDVNAGSLTDKVFYGGVDSLGWNLSQMFKDKSAKDYTRMLKVARKDGERYLLLHRDVSYSQLKEMRQFPLFRMGRYKGGLIVIQKSRRERPFKILASRTIGYERDGLPVGLEGAFDKYLAGISGQRLCRRLSGGNWMPLHPDNDENEVEPQDGKDLISTIDVNIQDVAEHSLLTQLAKHNADHGCVVLMEVQTGAVKAIANLSRGEEGIYSEKYNYAIGEASEPGSTFKLASLIAAIDDGYADITDSVSTENGTTRFYDRVMRDSHEGGYGRVSLQRAFEVSSNVGISKVIYRNYSKHPQAFVDRLISMHLDRPLGLQIPGESSPKIKTTKSKDWYGTTLPWMSIGYEVKCTPMQILSLYNAVANNGKMVKPMFVSEIQQKGKTIEKFAPVVLNESICSSTTIAKVKMALEGVVERGTATNLKNPNYKIAGKTGTAQIADGKSSYKNSEKVRYQASFVGYFPAENPKYSCIVVINSPSNNVYYANLVAGPVFKDIADKVYSSRLELHQDIEKQMLNPDYNIPLAKAGYQKETVKAYSALKIATSALTSSKAFVCDAEIKNKTVELNEKSFDDSRVPDVRGMGLMDAVYLLENRGILVKVLGKGVVRRQSLEAGSYYEKGVQMVLELSSNS